jgi:hypothetical protein
VAVGPPELSRAPQHRLSGAPNEVPDARQRWPAGAGTGAIWTSAGPAIDDYRIGARRCNARRSSSLSVPTADERPGSDGGAGPLVTRSSRHTLGRPGSAVVCASGWPASRCSGRALCVPCSGTSATVVVGRRLRVLGYLRANAFRTALEQCEQLFEPFDVSGYATTPSPLFPAPRFCRPVRSWCAAPTNSHGRRVADQRRRRCWPRPTPANSSVRSNSDGYGICWPTALTDLSSTP